ncbi:hypothetical protein AGABI2DRAFT_78087, partial [Agaricus bisporus var. bisporus H97]|uniref:hypothetical protein n=1 Tax=Agaricus bisporus var. bisporus (strain H97 / ATCC MYA-4626 / FGSC 10389) TaxID=936046 RepID=UPI00029F6666
IPPRLGLLDDSSDRWRNFRKRITELDEEARKENGSVKVFFFARHGQGWHNVAEAKYGTKHWDAEMSIKNGDDDIIWGPDPELTPIGINQAMEARRGWEEELAFGITLPDKLYSSPLVRAMDTLRVTFEGIFRGDTEKQPTVLVVENCREENGIHTCDQRRSRSFIHERFPTFEFEEGLTEEDELWDAEIRETKAQVSKRAQDVLDYIFQKDTDSTYISVTAHGGIINGFLQAIGRPSFPLLTGGMLAPWLVFDLSSCTLSDVVFFY